MDNVAVMTQDVWDSLSPRPVGNDETLYHVDVYESLSVCRTFGVRAKDKEDAEAKALELALKEQLKLDGSKWELASTDGFVAEAHDD